VTYAYDPSGQRVHEQAQGKETWFVFDGLSVVMELDQAKSPTSVFVPGLSKTDLTTTEPLTEWYLHDGLGSVVMLADVLGNPTQTYAYDVFGANLHGHTDPLNRYRFVGLAADDVTGLTYMNARWYFASICPEWTAHVQRLLRSVTGIRPPCGCRGCRGSDRRCGGCHCFSRRHRGSGIRCRRCH
jgi:hypothetical protein